MPRMGPRIVAKAARVMGQIDTAALEELTVRLLQRTRAGGVDVAVTLRARDGLGLDEFSNCLRRGDNPGSG